MGLEPVFRALKPVIIVLGKLEIPFSKRKLSGADYDTLRMFMRTGDVLLSLSRGKSSNAFIPGFWSHAALITGYSRVIEATGDGVECSHIYDFCQNKDFVALLRPNFLTDSEAKEAAFHAIRMRGKPYDYLFSNGVDAFYCSELVTWAYEQVKNHQSPFSKRQIKLIGETVLPSDFWNAKGKFDLLYTNTDLKR